MWASRIFSSILVLVGTPTAFALTLPNQECVLDAHHSGWTDLKKVAVMPEDGRYGLSEGAPVVGLSKDEATWISQVTGSVICRDPKTKALTGGSGTVFGRNDQIITSAHVLLEEKNLKPDCYFMTKTQPPVWRRLLVGSKKTVFGTKDTDAVPSQDVVLVKLDKPLSVSKPVKILPEIEKMDQKQKVILVSANQLRMTRAIADNEAVVQQCEVRNIDPLRSDASRMMYTDCSVTETASGSMSFVRAKDGQLYGAGVVKTAGVEAFDGQPYDYYRRNRAASVVFDEVLQSSLRARGASF